MSDITYVRTAKGAVEASNRIEQLESALRDCLSDLEWATREVPGTNFVSSIIKARAALGIAVVMPKGLVRFANHRLGCDECGSYWDNSKRNIKHLDTCSKSSHKNRSDSPSTSKGVKSG
jgi:hypothetical protein